jgi:hypothetical protein
MTTATAATAAEQAQQQAEVAERDAEALADRGPAGRELLNLLNVLGFLVELATQQAVVDHILRGPASGLTS